MKLGATIFRVVSARDVDELLKLHLHHTLPTSTSSSEWYAELRTFLPSIFDIVQDETHEAKISVFFESFPDDADLLRSMEEVDFRSIASRVQSQSNSSHNEDETNVVAQVTDFEASHENSVRCILMWIFRSAANPQSNTHHEFLLAKMYHSQINAALFSINLWLPDLVDVHNIVRFLIVDAPGNDVSTSSVHLLNFVKNCQDKFSDIVRSLLRWVAEEKSLQGVCKHVLIYMSNLAPGQASAIRTALVSQATLPELVLHISASILRDLDTFLLGVVHDTAHCKWFVDSYLLAKVDPGVLSKHLYDLESFISGASMLQYDTQTHRFLCRYFRSLCVIFRPGVLHTYTLQLSTASDSLDRCDRHLANRIVDVMTSVCDWQDKDPQKRTHHQDADACRSSQFLKIALCAVVTCPLLTNPTFTASARVTAWLQDLAARGACSDATHNAGHHDMLRLMGVHFSTENVRAVADLVRAELGFHIDIPVESLRRVCDMFGRHVYPNGSLLAQLMRVTPTTHLHRDMPGFLPVHSVHQLLRTRLFVRHQVQPRAWLLAQVLCLAPDLPLHPQMVGILECFADFAADPCGTILSGNDHPPRTEEQEWYTKPLEALQPSDILVVMDVSNVVAKVAVLFYLLTYNKAIRSRVQRLQRSGSTRVHQENQPYDVSFLRRLPVRALLNIAETTADRLFPDIFPQLHGLLLLEFPEYFLAYDRLRSSVFVAGELNHPLHGELTLAPALLHASRSSKKLQDDQPSNTTIQASPDVFNPWENPIAALATLTELSDASDDVLMASADVVISNMISALKKHASTGTLSPALDGQPTFVSLDDRRLHVAFLGLWHRLCALMPHHLWSMTALALQSNHNTLGTGAGVHETLLEDPLAVLRCDPAHLRCPTIMEMVLSLLDAYLAASDGILQRQCRAAASALSGSDGADDTVVFDRIVLTQRASVVQVLLEVCSDLLRTEETTGSAAEVQIQLCNFFHQLFLHQPLLVKLVHFQGYDWDIIPIMVRGVPSMHICLDFLPELLKNPHATHQVFAILIGGALAKRYTIAKMLEVARAIVGKANEMCNSDLSARISFFTPIFGALVQLCDAFPLMTEVMLQLLMTLLTLQRSEEVVCAATGPLAHEISEDAVCRFTEAIENTINIITSSAFMHDAI
eukprot:m.29928 g.29928  ORF g.29928 m.29928 type:complete len:1150 (+) comp13800_c0_seq5:137-3586(+)